VQLADVCSRWEFELTADLEALRLADAGSQLARRLAVLPGVWGAQTRSAYVGAKIRLPP
jgi:hypothetical protein